jgi:tRNA(adenine34) deaminase
MDERWMNEAISNALKALNDGEVPVGAVIVKGGEIIGSGYNRVEGKKLATAHAEIIAIEDATAKLGDWRLDGCSVYVTVEPCIMCLAALYLSRVSAVVYGAPQPRGGACGLIDNFHQFFPYNRKMEVRGGVKKEDCLSLLKVFFRDVRNKKGGEMRELA